MTVLTEVEATREIPAPGPFHPVTQTERRNEFVRALLTSLLALYPVLATVGVVIASLALTGSV